MFVRSIISLSVAASSQRALLSGSAVAGNKFAERERAFEESFIRKHEQEALAKLRAQLNNKASQSELAQSLNDLEHAMKQDDTPSAPDHLVTSAEFLAFRKEFVGKLRVLEDEISDLRFKLAKK